MNSAKYQNLPLPQKKEIIKPAMEKRTQPNRPKTYNVTPKEPRHKRYYTRRPVAEVTRDNMTYADYLKKINQK